MKCPCGSGDEQASCCEPYVKGEKQPPTAEALMRSRYASYTMEAVDYIASTHHAKTRDEVDTEAAKRWAEEAEWEGLEIVETEAGGASDETGVVEFIAKFSLQGQQHQHHERSTFAKEDGKWFYLDGDMVKPKPVTRALKVGRNEPCPCGSGKKFKRCCG